MEKLNFVRYFFGSKMIEIDFLIFEYLPLGEILRIFDFYFKNLEIKGKKILNLKFGNQCLINEIGQKYPVVIRCQYIVDPDKVNWDYLSGNPKAIELLEANPDKINWDYLSRNPEAIKLLEANPDKNNWDWLSTNPKAIHLLEANPDKINWNYLSTNPKAIHLLEANPDKIYWDFLSKNPEAVHLLEAIIM